MAVEGPVFDLFTNFNAAIPGVQAGGAQTGSLANLLSSFSQTLGVAAAPQRSTFTTTNFTSTLPIAGDASPASTFNPGILGGGGGGSDPLSAITKGGIDNATTMLNPLASIADSIKNFVAFFGSGCFASYFIRAIVILLGFIFVAIGLSQFKQAQAILKPVVSGAKKAATLGA